jgi:hypothetical protein
MPVRALTSGGSSAGFDDEGNGGAEATRTAAADGVETAAPDEGVVWPEAALADDADAVPVVAALPAPGVACVVEDVPGDTDGRAAAA